MKESTNRKFIPYGHQWIEEDDIQSVVSVLRNDWITQGSKIQEFEKAVAEFVGAKFAVAFSSGTAALHAACFAINLSHNDEVITSPISFVASSNCILCSGAKPVFADIKEDTHNIDISEIRKAITDKSKAIIPVDFAGQPADLDEIKEIAEEFNLTIIEDAAHALGAVYKGKRIGGISNLTVFSFHPVKSITTGEGGMVTANDESHYEKLKIFRNSGITRDRKKFRKMDEGPWYYEMQELSGNYRITDFQCALGLSQLKKLDMFLSRRRQIMEKYNQAFNGIPGITLPFEKSNCRSSWHIYPVWLDENKLKVNRKKIFEILRSEGIGVQIHYIPIYHHPYYQSFRYFKNLCPKAEKYYQGTITLPLFPSMTDLDVERIIVTFSLILDRYRKSEVVR